MTTNDKLADVLCLIERMRNALCKCAPLTMEFHDLFCEAGDFLSTPPAQGEFLPADEQPPFAGIAGCRPLERAPHPAPAPVQVDDTLGRFGHHPDPATDFEVEVTSLQGRLFNAKHAIPDKHGVTESVAQVADAIKRAMTFRVGGVETSVRAKSILRALELDAAQPPAPGEAVLLSMIDDVAADLTDHKSLAYEKLRKVRAAIAALAQQRIDLRQFRNAVSHYRDHWRLAEVRATAAGSMMRAEFCADAAKECERLLALIDQQQEALGNGE